MQGRPRSRRRMYRLNSLCASCIHFDLGFTFSFLALNFCFSSFFWLATCFFAQEIEQTWASGRKDIKSLPQALQVAICFFVLLASSNPLGALVNSFLTIDFKHRRSPFNLCHEPASIFHSLANHRQLRLNRLFCSP